MGFKVGLKTNTSTWNKMRKNLSKADYTSKVGFFKGSYGNVSVPQVAVWQDQGTLNIPPRPFVRIGLVGRIKREGLSKHFRKAHLVAMGSMTWRQLNLSISKELVEKLQEAIINWQSPRNAPSTIRKKGFDDPLIGLTGKLFDNAEAKVVRR